MDKLTIFTNRLNKIGISVELVGNYPWIYLSKVNGVSVGEKFMSNHGFTLAFTPLKYGCKDVEFSDVGEVFRVIRGCL
jgi:hypothetical protein